jgi:aspartyl-tRNA(Asn)/glutamyl-tRNA(Gln) amidotransferase subunit A
MDMTQTTLVSLRDAIAGKKVSATAAVKACLDRIDRFNGQLNAYNETYHERALSRASQVDSGKVTGPLAGVPIAIKDNMCTDYGHTTCSSKILANFKAPYNATAVARLEAAGAIVLGKTNLDEFAMGSSTENSSRGTSKNPWDVTRVPGGSSGGASSAMAADMCIGSLGSDTGGSIRQPAALCGIVGYKPSYGLVSRYGLVAFASSLDQIGPFAHTVEDTALIMQIMSGHDPLDSTSAKVAVPDYFGQVNQKVSGLRIGIAKQYLSDSNDASVKEAVDAALKALKGLGATVVEVDLPHTEYGIPTYYIVATAEASSNLARFDGIRYGHRSDKAQDLIDVYSRSRAEGFGPEVKRRIMLGTYALSSGYGDQYYLTALKVRRLIKGDFDKAFTSCDAILCPTTTGPAFKFGAKTDNPLEMYMQDVYTVNANLAGIPGISLPYGFANVDGKKLPIGLQLLGPAFEDVKLLRIARMLEQTASFHAQRPGLA